MLDSADSALVWAAAANTMHASFAQEVQSKLSMSPEKK
jgi:hypothetical protein